MCQHYMIKSDLSHTLHLRSSQTTYAAGVTTQASRTQAGTCCSLHLKGGVLEEPVASDMRGCITILRLSITPNGQTLAWKQNFHVSMTVKQCIQDLHITCKKLWYVTCCPETTTKTQKQNNPCDLY